MTDRPSIRALVVEALQSSMDPSPRAVADEVIAALPRSRYEEALRASLWLFVRSVSSTGQSLSDGQSTRARGRPHAESTAAVHSMGQARVAAWLRRRVPVAPRVYKFLGDCTADDLDVMATVRHEHAKANTTQADLYERLASLMRAAGVDRLADLPDLETEIAA